MDKTLLGLTITEWLAIIGAFAWLPTIVQWLKDYFTKPKLTIVSGRQVSVGFTTFGPILNMNLAFLSESKKSLIKQIDLELIHENNDTQKFSWVWFEETLYTMDIPDAPAPINTKKNQNAIAIKVGLDELVEKTIGFQQNTFKNEYDRHYKQLTEDAIDFFQLQKSPDDLKITPSYRALNDLFPNSFNWKVGRYSVKVNAIIAEGNLSVPHSFTFTLNNLDIKLLQNNVELCQTVTAKTFVDDNLVTRQWQWITANKQEQ